MAEVQISSDLQILVKRLSALKMSTPNEAPEYPALKACYVAASDLLERSQEQAIDDEDAGYLEFFKGMKDVMPIFDEAEKDIARVSKAVKMAAKVVEVAGKVIGKVC